MDLTAAIAIIFFFGSVFGISYIYFSTRHRERMNMIDKGLTPGSPSPMTDHLRTLKTGMVLIGLGAGVLGGHLFSMAMLGMENDNPLPYFVGMAIFGGLSMVLFYTFFGRKQQG